MRLVDRVWMELGPKADVAWPTEQVVFALRLAATMVWANTIRPTTTITIPLTNGEGTVPPTHWPLYCVTEGVALDAKGIGKVVAWPPDVSSVEVAASPVPPTITSSTTTLGWEPDLDDAAAELAAAILLAPTMPDTASALHRRSMTRQMRVMAQWRNSKDWRLRRGRP